MTVEIKYKWPNFLFFIWLAASLFIAVFFYDAGNNLAGNIIQFPHQLLIAYMSYLIAVGFVMLGLLPYGLGLEIHFKSNKPLVDNTKEESVEQPADNTPVGYDYFIPLWGWLKYQLPNLLKGKKWIVIIENFPPYFLVGLFNGLVNYPLTPLFVFALSIAVIVEYFAYYRNWMPFMKTPRNVSRTQMGIAYLVVQEHAFSFMAIGWIIGAVIH